MRRLAAPVPSQPITRLRPRGMRSLQSIASLSRQSDPAVHDLAGCSLAIDPALPRHWSELSPEGSCHAR